MGLDSWFKGLNKNEKNTLKKAAIVSGAGLAAAGALTAVGMHEDEKEYRKNEKELLQTIDAMPVDHVDPTAGKTPDSAPDPITIPKPETGVL